MSELSNMSPDDMLYHSIINNYLNGVKISIERGADYDSLDVLEMAVNEDKLDIIKYLISIGIEIPEDITVMLQLLIENKNEKIIDYLIELYIEKYKNIENY